MSSRPAADTIGEVEIRIWLDQLDPPAGRLRHVGPGKQHVGDAVEIADAGFTGWLGLLRALDRLIGSRDEPPGVECGHGGRCGTP